MNQIRILKNSKRVYEKVNDENYHFKFNNTLIGTKLYDDLLPDNEKELIVYDRLNPINLIKENGIKDLTIIILFVFKLFFKDFRVYYIIGISNELEQINIVFIITISIFSAGILFLFLFVWRPFETRLNKTVTIIQYNY